MAKGFTVDRIDQVRVLGPRILMRVEEPPKQVGRIIMADGVKEEPRAARVLALGRAENSDGSPRPIGVAVGDRVLIQPFAKRTPLKVGVETLHLMDADGIFSVIDDKAEVRKA